MRTLLKLLAGVLILFVLATVVGFVRAAVVAGQIRQEQANLSAAPMGDFGSTRSLEILPLYEAEALDGLGADRGVSYLIRTDDAQIIMDLGNGAMMGEESMLAHNMAALGVRLNTWYDRHGGIDTIVISHRHPDHVGGMDWWLRGSFSPEEHQPWLSLVVFVPEIMYYPEIVTFPMDDPHAIKPGVAILGTIPFPEVFPINLIQPRRTELMLAIQVEGQGVVLVTGCGHPGLELILDRAEAMLDAPVIGIVGGLHLGNADAAALQPQIDLLAALNPQIVAVSPHDSGPAAIEAFRAAFPDAYHDLRVGEAIHFGE